MSPRKLPSRYHHRTPSYKSYKYYYALRTYLLTARHPKLPSVVDRPSGSIFAKVFEVHLDERYHCGPDSPWGTSVQGAGSKGVLIAEGLESAAWT